jgi:DNA (cytosine-5)-methyltransferase 1
MTATAVQTRIQGIARSRLRLGEIAVDLFAGGGGASSGIEAALGIGPAVAINHDPAAIEMHAANHPDTQHFCESVFDVDPRHACAGRPVGLLWASPDCTHFSRAKGGKPRSQKIRGLAWIVVTWAAAVAPRVIAMENVPEFLTWGPLDEEGQPIEAKEGETFREFVAQLRALGYEVDWRVLSAADYGAPTWRRRLFLVARRDGEPVRWPSPTHGPDREHPYRTAAECIDWSIRCPSIFDRERPLADATCRRIAHGVHRYVIDAADPFIVGIDQRGTGDGCSWGINAPLSTITTKARHALVAPTLIQTSYGERKGQRPRSLNLHEPLGTVVAGGQKHAVVAAFLAKHYGGVVGHEVTRPLGAVTAKDHHSLVAAHLTKFYGTSTGAPLDQPAPTVTGQGQHAGLVAAFLQRYYSNGGQWPSPADPAPTITSKARLGLVLVHVAGEPYVIADLGMRMLQPRELARAQGFGDAYVLTGTKTQQVARIGNSVCPPVAAAVVRANLATGRAVAA